MPDIVDGSSPLALAYVQLCQITVGEFGLADIGRQFDAAWACMSMVPAHVEHGAVPVVWATFLMACAFLKARDTTACACTPSSQRRQHVLDLLAETRRQFADPQLCLGILAQQHGFARSYLSRALAAETRYGFRRHLNGVRLVNALVHLGDPAVPIKQVADRVGYVGPGELDRQLTRSICMTPGQFRRLLADGRSLRIAALATA